MTFPTAAQPFPQPFPQPLAPIAAPQQQVVIEDINDTIYRWSVLNDQIESLRQEEVELRQRINKSQLFDQSRETGSQHYNLGNDYSLNIVRPENVKVDNKDNAVNNAIIRLKNLGADQAIRAGQLFKFEASLSKKVYDVLTPEERAIVDPLITRKPGLVQMKLKTPKAE